MEAVNYLLSYNHQKCFVCVYLRYESALSKEACRFNEPTLGETWL